MDSVGPPLPLVELRTRTARLTAIRLNPSSTPRSPHAKVCGEKPHAAIFRGAPAAVDAAPEGAFRIGDSVGGGNAVGAAAAAMRAIFLRRDGSGHDELEAIPSLAAMAALLRATRWQRARAVVSA